LIYCTTTLSTHVLQAILAGSLRRSVPAVKPPSVSECTVQILCSDKPYPVA
jgi:hypothetical protein